MQRGLKTNSNHGKEHLKFSKLRTNTSLAREEHSEGQSLPHAIFCAPPASQEPDAPSLTWGGAIRARMAATWGCFEEGTAVRCGDTESPQGESVPRARYNANCTQCLCHLRCRSASTFSKQVPPSHINRSE
eukprot:6093220-Amphidinium_carterae.1